jgi:hypothetical protein
MPEEPILTILAAPSFVVCERKVLEEHGSDASTEAQTKDKAPAKPRTAESIECSKQADAKGLHGKERKVFRAKCKKDLAKPANKPA